MEHPRQPVARPDDRDVVGESAFEAGPAPVNPRLAHDRKNIDDGLRTNGELVEVEIGGLPIRVQSSPVTATNQNGPVLNLLER